MGRRVNVGEGVGLFDSKAKRIARHRQLIELARSTLEQLQLGAKKLPGENVTSPVWTEAAEARIPLEYRWWLSLHLATLVCALHDTEEGELGDRDWIRELSESLTATRNVMAGPPEAGRSAFRAEAFARFQGVLKSEFSELAEALATDDWLSLWSDGIGRTLPLARTARSWFTNQSELDAADALAMKNQKRRKHPKPSLYEMDTLIKDSEAALAKAKAASENP